MKNAQKVPQVAILVDTATGWGRRVVKGILSYVSQAGPWHLWIRPTDRNHTNQLPKGWGGDGIIVRIPNASLAEHLRETGIPVVNVSGIQVDGVEFPRVTGDGERVAEVAVEHFLNRGFRHFGYVGPLRETCFKKMQSHFELKLVEQDYDCHVFPVKEVDLDRDFGKVQKSFRKWLVSLPKPIGIFAWGSTFGRDVIDACLYENISVPHDVAVLGGDYDELLCEASYPPLSGVVTAAEQIGYHAAKTLHQLMMGKPVENPDLLIEPSRIEGRLSTDTIAVKDPKLTQAIQFIREHACQPITVDDIIRSIPMSRRLLESRFKQVFGRTILEEIRRLRINKARKLLAETEMSMSEIAQACGYGNYNYLTNVFKRTTGETPSTYRKSRFAKINRM